MNKLEENIDFEIETKLKLAKQAAKINRQNQVEVRTNYLARIRKVICEQLEDILADLIKDTAKVDVEALIGDILPTLDMIKYYEMHASKILASEKRKTPLTLFNNRSYVEYEPLGVVLVIAPWNYPLQLSLLPAITALVAGNAVIIKPSEVTPLVGDIIKRIVKEADLPEGMIQVVSGAGNVGKKLIKAKPDKIFFTGSVATGKKVMEQAAKNLIPVELELGGKDAMIVCQDANFERAVEAAVYGAFSNSGQICVSTERLYVHQEIYQDFLEAVVERTKKLRVGQGREADLGKMTFPAQIEVLNSQLEDALAKGAKLLTEVKQQDGYFYPLILTDVDHDMTIMTEESFGPILPIMPFSDLEEVIKYHNSSDFGLNASLWSQDLKLAEEIGKRLEVGNIYINDVIKNISNPYLPFGGVKQSGIGRYHGPEGLYSFSQSKSVMINKNKGSELNWFPYDNELYQLLVEIIEFKYAPTTVWAKFKSVISLIPKLIKKTILK